MKTSYAVKWREPDGKTYLGRLEFAPKALVLEGRENGSPPTRRTLRYDELGGFHLGRAGAERLDGQPALVVECGGDPAVAVEQVLDQRAVDAAGAVETRVQAGCGQTGEERDQGISVLARWWAQAQGRAVAEDDVDELGPDGCLHALSLPPS
jgi:hypothetical protein